MDHLSLPEILESIDVIIASMEQNEQQFYVSLELAYQLRDQVDELLNDQ